MNRHGHLSVGQAWDDSRRTSLPRCSPSPLLAASRPAAAGAAGKIAAAGSATIVGTPGDDVLWSAPGRRRDRGLQGDDRIRALAGNDLLCGGEGTDTLSGGAGDDLLLDGLGAGVLSGGAGNDRLDRVGGDPSGEDGADGRCGGRPGRDCYFMRFVLQGGAILSDLSGKVDLLHGWATIEAGRPGRTLPVTGIEQIEVSRGRWTLYRQRTRRGRSWAARTRRPA